MSNNSLLRTLEKYKIEYESLSMGNFPNHAYLERLSERIFNLEAYLINKNYLHAVIKY